MRNTIFVLAFILFFAGCEAESAPSTKAQPNEVEEAPVEVEKTLDEKLIEDITSKDIEVLSIDSNADDADFGEYVLIQIYDINDEERVYNTIYEIMDSMRALDVNKQYIIEIFDKDYKDDVLASYFINVEGDIKSWFVADYYNTFYNKWVNSQFSVWNGQHDALVELVKQSMNDEKSFKHISTNYRVIYTEDDAADVNKVLSDAGYDNKVEVNDIYIFMEFSGKNAFNATIKNYAIGVASYNQNTITLVDFGA